MISEAILLTICNLPIPARHDGIVTALCQPNLKFSVPYDISSWGSCLAKCPASKPVPPEPLDKHKLLLLDEDYMTEEKVVCRIVLECFSPVLIFCFPVWRALGGRGDCLQVQEWDAGDQQQSRPEDGQVQVQGQRSLQLPIWRRGRIRLDICQIFYPSNFSTNMKIYPKNA